ncbi:hypothetical protein AM587_10002172 [Phytophthora nicotianae]|nr:hypothetical protein AM587_10002172 [Phytophthora nicotianae]
MDAILARVGVSDTALRAHCSNAVHDELQQAEKRLQKPLAALKRALEVAEASRELYKSSQALVDESPDVSSMLSRVVSSCNAIGPLTRKLHQTRLPREFPETTKLRKHIAANFETPAEEVVIIQERLKKMLKEVRGWCRDDPYSVSVFEDRLQFVKETIEASGYEGYEPRWDKSIAELLFRFGCCLQAFHTGWAQDRRYDTIRALLSEMKSQERR